MSKSEKFVFQGLHVVAWVIFVGLSIEAAGLLVNFVVSLFKPAFVQNLYQKLDLSEMYERSQWAYFGMYTFMLVVAFSKAYLFYLLIRLLDQLDLSNPFNSIVAEQIKKIASCTFSIGLLSYIAHETARNLQHRGYVIDALDQFWVDSEAFILMSAIIYVIAVIFKKGVEIQNENALTI
jgi:Protein of unknown function (DUF2975)